jgi:hypothetical protein
VTIFLFSVRVDKGHTFSGDSGKFFRRGKVVGKLSVDGKERGIGEGGG